MWTSPFSGFNRVAFRQCIQGTKVFALGVATPLLVATILYFGGATLAAQPASGIQRGPYVQLATTNSIHIVWRSVGPMQPVVWFGTSQTKLDRQSKPEDVVTRVSLGTNGQTLPSRYQEFRTESNLKLPPLHSAPIGTFQYEVKLTGLEPGSTYYYAAFNGTTALTSPDASYRFKTLPPKESDLPIRFWVIGDAGTGRKQQVDVLAGMQKRVEEDGRPLDFWLYAGDIAYGTGRDNEFQTRFFKPYESILKNLVCWPSMGNHEGFTSKGTIGVGPYYDAYVLPTKAEAGGLASGTEAYYSFDYGKVHFICLESHDLDRKPSGAMAKWLTADLEKANGAWIIAYWHHPPYTKGSHDSDKEKDLTEMRQYIMPILEAGGVDLVLCGHSHTYERSMLFDGAYATPTVAENVVLDDGDGDPGGDGPYLKSAGLNPHEGTVMIVTGHAGQNLGRKGTLPFMRRTMTEHGSLLVDVEGQKLVARMVDTKGVIRDICAIQKAGKVELAKLSVPWQPAEFKPVTNQFKVVPTPAVHHKVLVPKGASWKYLAGQHPIGQAWTGTAFDDSKWPSGRSGIGTGEFKLLTDLGNLKDKPKSLYIRTQFNVDQADRITELGLMINYLDSLVAYVNGREVARAGVGRSRGRNAQNISVRDGFGAAYVAFRDSAKVLKDGVNTLAIEIHAAKDRPDILADPTLIMEE